MRARRKAARLAAAFALALVVLAGPALAERRVALVVGNAAYRNAEALRTPTSDADHVADMLRRLDFAVSEVKDVDKPGMEQALRRFAADISGADVALFYYSGHGVQLGDESYILPVSARTDSQRNLALDAFAVLDVNAMMRAAGARTRLLFLDSCRNNPFTAEFASTVVASARSIDPQSLGGGALIAFSAAPGQVALDGTGEVSPFTQGFLKFAAAPNVEVRQMMARIRGFVADQTLRTQTPWDNSSLVDDVYLAPRRAPPSFERLARIQLPADGAGELRLVKPTITDGGALTVRIEQAPTAGQLTLDSKPVGAGQLVDAARFDKLAYRRAGQEAADAFSFRVQDEWGHSELGLVAIEFSGLSSLKPASAPARPSVKATLAATSLIGVGPNLSFRSAPQTPADPSTALKMTEDPAFGQFRLGDRVIGKDRVVTLADLPLLTFLPTAGAEGRIAHARFIGVDRAEDSVDIAVAAEVSDCDRLAGDRLDPQGVTSGVFSSHIEVGPALSACERAARQNPRSGRFAYELARVYAALGRNADADAGLRKAVDLGHIRAQWALGYRALYLPPLKEREGLEWLEKATALGDVNAEHTLGQAYYEGRGAAKDWDKARRLFEKAAEGGQELSMDALGRMYQRGETVAVNRPLARRFWEESVARGDIYGLDNLGYVYLEGIGAAQDFSRALAYFHKASELGHPEAPNNIGRLYLNGLGVKRDVGEARRWYALGMKRGDGWAAFNLGELARLGVGGPPDAALAAYYYARAAASSNRQEPANLGREALASQSEDDKTAGLRRPSPNSPPPPSSLPRRPCSPWPSPSSPRMASCRREPRSTI